ncbi:hypothetical protein HD554DRAFT_2037714 [Boletus coccyginus]|nr:hypothetical protein HD554DRAFT_2037714 [Boletus coccyginus]
MERETLHINTDTKIRARWIRKAVRRRDKDVTATHQREALRRPDYRVTRAQNNRRTTFHHYAGGSASEKHERNETAATHLAGDDGGFSTATVRGNDIVMVAPRAATEVAITTDVFFIDRNMFALDGRNKWWGQKEGGIVVHRGVAEAERRTLWRDGRRDMGGRGWRACEGGGRREGRGASVRCTRTGAYRAHWGRASVQAVCQHAVRRAGRASTGAQARAGENTTHLEHIEGPTTPGRIAVESARWHVEHENFAHENKGGAFGVGATLELSVSARLAWHPESVAWLSLLRLKAGFRADGGDAYTRGVVVRISRWCWTWPYWVQG